MFEAIFLDRDGTLNVERKDYVKAWHELAWLPGVLDELRRLAAVPAPILVVTNQSAIGRGLVSRNAVDQIHARMQQVIHAAGGRVDEFYVCPHRPEDNCPCRKPKPGLLLKAAADLEIDLTKCVLIGDTVTDYGAASAVGCRCVLVQTGRQGAQLPNLVAGGDPVAIVADLASAVDLLLAQVSPTTASVA